MSLSRISNYEMRALSLRLLEPERAGILQADAYTTGFVGGYQDVLSRFDEAGDKPKTDDGAKKALQQLAAQWNTVYDSGVSLTDDLLSTIERHFEQLGDSAQASAVATYRQRLLPDGKLHMRQSYLGQAGHAVEVKQLLAQQPELANGLAALPLPGGVSMAEVVERWVNAGEELGQIEAQRGDAPKDIGPSAAMLAVAARNEWLRTTTGLLHMSALAKSLTPEQREFLLRPITEAAAAAALRKKDPNPAASPVVPEVEEA